jgi:hypothetical protein
MKQVPLHPKDAGMVFSLLALLTGWLGSYEWAFWLAGVSLLLNLIWPPLFAPFAWLWSRLSAVLGTLSSYVLLSLIFFLVVTPIGLLRRWLGKDSLQLRSFRRDQTSVWHKPAPLEFQADDLTKPF